MTVFEAWVLGIVQGLTEFLPISSSAHLSLAPWLLGWEDPGLAFDVALHFGTLVAVLWYFRRDWVALSVAAFSMVRHLRVSTVEERRVVFLVIATIPAAFAGFLLEEKAETVFRAPVITALALIVLGILLWAGDRFSSAERNIAGLRWLDALLIGFAQVLALVPGVSRSGSTITAARFLRLDRQSAAIFSFLMSMPVILAAVVFKGPEVMRTTGLSAELAAGVLGAAISSWLAIAILLRYVSRHSYGIFALYRLILGGLVLFLLYVRG